MLRSTAIEENGCLQSGQLATTADHSVMHAKQNMWLQPNFPTALPSAPGFAKQTAQLAWFFSRNDANLPPVRRGVGGAMFFAHAATRGKP
jgi:hypothetical protein